MSYLRFVISSNLARSSIRNILRPCLLRSEPSKQQLQKVNLSYSVSVAGSNSKGLKERMFDLFSNSNARLRSSSVLLYENVVDKLKYPDFYNEFNMPDTFFSWFLVTELHCWMVLTRVMHEGSETNQDGRFMRNFIVETMWGDVTTRSKKLSPDNPSASRLQVYALSEQFQAALMNYDEGLMDDDKTLASALWRRFFNMECDDYRKLERLVKYVRESTLILDSMTREQLLRRPDIKWPELN